MIGADDCNSERNTKSFTHGHNEPFNCRVQLIESSKPAVICFGQNGRLYALLCHATSKFFRRFAVDFFKEL
jgi:hypothetical protein